MDMARKINKLAMNKTVSVNVGKSLWSFHRKIHCKAEIHAVVIISFKSVFSPL